MSNGYFTARLSDMVRQEAAAGRLMAEFTVFARSIGCETFQDEILGNTQQMGRLDAWWRARTGTRHV